MKGLKSINIKGKEYVEVNERLRYFRENFKDWSLESDILEKKDTSILIKATIKDADGRIIATGLAEEIKGSTFINKTSYIENCETSAWGRALGNLGIGIETSVASYEEKANSIKQSSPDPKPKKKLTSKQFKEAIQLVQKGEYTAEKLVANYDLSKNQIKTLELC